MFILLTGYTHNRHLIYCITVNLSLWFPFSGFPEKDRQKGNTFLWGVCKTRLTVPLGG